MALSSAPPLAASPVPLLVLDTSEHTQDLQYQNVKGDRVTAFWQLVHGEDVAQRFAKMRTGASARIETDKRGKAHGQ